MTVVRPPSSGRVSCHHTSLLCTVGKLFFFNAPATTEIYTLSLHDALPIYKEISPPAIAALAKQQDAAIAWIHRADRKSTRLNSSHSQISYAVFCLKKKRRLQQLGAVTALKVDDRGPAAFLRPCLLPPHIAVVHSGETFFFQCAGDHRDLHSFPTRRSSDLQRDLPSRDRSARKAAGRCDCMDPSRRSEEHTSELQSQSNLVCRLLLEKKTAPAAARCGDRPEGG